MAVKSPDSPNQTQGKKNFTKAGENILPLLKFLIIICSFRYKNHSQKFKNFQKKFG